ncbi:MAG: serine protease [Actinomycetota bacterium]
MTSQRGAAGAVLAAMLVLAACTASKASPSVTNPADGPTSTISTVSTPDTAPAERIYEQVADSIVSIETDIAGGSGILIDDGLVLTAAHVVWPYRTVRVVFPSGAEIVNAPVVGSDPFGDLALVDVAAADRLPKPAEIGDGESIPLGRSVYLIGYPGESEAFPQPTITQGILSRAREWAAGEWTFLQTDTTVTGGQSGGALVDEDGAVVGITNFSFLEEFGLSGSLTDAAATIERMKAGEDVGGLGDRLPPTGRGSDVHRFSFDHVWQDHVFVFDAPLYSNVSFTVNSDEDLQLTLATIDGFEISIVDDTLDGQESIEELVTYLGPHILRVDNYTGSASGRLRSSEDLVEWPDPDDGRRLVRDTTISGNVDYPGDFDWYLVDLGKGQAVTIDVDSIAFDPVLMIDGPEGLGRLRALDDDSGGGLFGTNPRIVFTAREAGSFFVIVADSGSTGPGAYWLTVD